MLFNNTIMIDMSKKYEHRVSHLKDHKHDKKGKRHQDGIKPYSTKNKVSQLKKEEKLYESLRKRREKIELQIKVKNQKLKQKQQMLKKQIDDKNRKLKSLSKKPSIAKSGKKSLNKKTVSVR